MVWLCDQSPQEKRASILDAHYGGQGALNSFNGPRKLPEIGLAVVFLRSIQSKQEDII